jgi:hypothetical protein
MKAQRIIQAAKVVMALAMFVLFGIPASHPTTIPTKAEQRSPACAGSAQEVKP